ncbi:MAG: MBL fold metallo-hydrolase [Thermoprotei archaeon]|nr:MAG: MBL fold metallo-hydrolase [Thermoprotei archaeon]
MSLSSAAERLEITVVMDNYVDVLLKPGRHVERWGPKQSLTSPTQPLAEHGLSLLIDVYGEEGRRRVLMDFGFTEVGVPHNLKLLGIDPSTIDALFLSHGHRDHYASLIKVLKSIGKPTPLFVHPDAFNLKLFTLPDGTTLGPWRLSLDEVEAAGGIVVATRNPTPIASGLFTSGEVERVTDFEKPMRMAKTVKDGLFTDDQLMDDQALVAKLKSGGVVVIAGCAHSGIINTIKHSLRIAGEDKLKAVIGGFHLSGAEEEVVNKTVEELKRLNPSFIMPMHCTGFEAAVKIMQALPEAFVLSSVGTKVILE